MNRVILTADMEGFSTRLQEDEEGVIGLLVETYYTISEKAVRENGGTLFRREGDAIWCHFPAAAAALKAGLRIIEELFQQCGEVVRLRVGIHSGSVTEKNGELFGNTLKVARRLENSAPVGSVHLSEAAYRALPQEDRGGLSERGAQDVSGVGLVRTYVAAPSPSRLAELSLRRATPRLVVAAILTELNAKKIGGWLQNALALASQLNGRLLEWEEKHALLLLPPETLVDRDTFLTLTGPPLAMSRGNVLLHRVEGSAAEEVVGGTVEDALDLASLAWEEGLVLLTREALPNVDVRGVEAWGSWRGRNVYHLPKTPSGIGMEPSVRVSWLGEHLHHSLFSSEHLGTGANVAERLGQLAVLNEIHPPDRMLVAVDCDRDGNLYSALDKHLQRYGRLGAPLILAEPHPEFPHALSFSREARLHDWFLSPFTTSLTDSADQLVIVLVGPLEGDPSELVARLSQRSGLPQFPLGLMWEEAVAELGLDSVRAVFREWASHLGASELAEPLKSSGAIVLSLFPDPRVEPMAVNLSGTVDQPLLGDDEDAALGARLAQLAADLRLALCEKRQLWVLCPGCDDRLKQLLPHFSRLFPNPHPPLLVASGLEFTQQKKWERRGFQVLPGTLAQVLAALPRKPKLPAPAALAAPDRPYKFLNYYSREDRSIFFGRENEIQELVVRTLASPVLVVYGKSGVGKTSLLRAGLLPHFTPPRDWVMTIRVLSEPVALLRRRLAQVLRVEPGAGLAVWLRQASECVHGRVILVLDQFEEFFVRCTPAERQIFLNELARFRREAPARCHVVLSLREDFLAEMAEFEDDVLKKRFRVTGLTREQASEAILGPARLFGIHVDPQLVDELLDQLSEEGIDPPELQIVLDRLYQENPRSLTLANYQKLGGVRGVLVGYLQTTLAAEDSLQARQLLKAMVTERGTKAVVTAEELAAKLRQPAEELLPLLHMLADYRLVRTLSEEGEAHFELAHEYLVQEVRSWQSEEEVAARHAMLVLRSEMRNYKRNGLLVPPDRLQLICQERSRLSLSGEERRMLVRASALQGVDPMLWLEEDGSQSIGTEVLLAMLDEDLDARVHREALMALFQLPSDDKCVLRMVEAARKVGNPTLLERLHSSRPEAGRVLTALRKAVWMRYFGPQAMACVQDGPAWLGSTRQNKEDRKSRLRADLHERIDTEADFREVELSTFWIDKLLVTNAEYAEFHPEHAHLFPPEEARHPAVNVSYEEACHYAHWLGKELPTELEWEKAARGTDGRLFPWGNEFDPARLNSAESGLRRLTPVDAYPEGASPFGCLNMAGTVWEWTSSPWEEDTPLMAKKGGCTVNFEPHQHCSARFEDPPEMRSRWVGFRLVQHDRKLPT